MYHNSKGFIYKTYVSIHLIYKNTHLKCVFAHARILSVSYLKQTYISPLQFCKRRREDLLPLKKGKEIVSLVPLYHDTSHAIRMLFRNKLPAQIQKYVFLFSDHCASILTTVHLCSEIELSSSLASLITFPFC